jgi:hypothetical protein
MPHPNNTLTCYTKFLRMEAADYRTRYQSMTPQAKMSSAKKIYLTFLSSRATLPVDWNAVSYEATVEDVLDNIKSQLESPEQHIFDDIAFLAMQTMESLYKGTFVPDSGAQDRLRMADMENIRRFKSSVFHQAMRNDLRMYIMVFCDD